jgi:hypothetical protein
MPSFKTFVGFTNVFEDGNGRRYLSGIVHPTAADAVARRSDPNIKGRIVGVAEIHWDEPDDAPWKPWTKKS